MARYEFFLASSLEKVFPAQRPAALSDGARLSVWRGARAAVQLVYRADDAAPGMPVQSFTIEADGAPAPAVLRAVELMPIIPATKARTSTTSRRSRACSRTCWPRWRRPRLHRCRASTAACG